ncbi:hypothetical protein FSP39_018481 [Pinctada imbricata]|uniref:Glycoside-hydrolase family GH114 TIM-barrel domain-containing protein n=1 Tax=Pinctada imbricata TaxID=66713 RepID=A0AA89BXM1_PINIB|nr:hypothetical protein FSP39_018481 [Pinctada imbricata]
MLRILVAGLLTVCTEAVYRPSATTSWQWQINSGHPDTSVHVTMYDVDLFEAGESGYISRLKSAGHKVICYFSAGSYEKWRPDAGQFPPDVLGHKLDGWDERWLDIRDDRVKTIMRARLDKAVHYHCDGVEPDNVDGYTNHNDLGLTASDQLAYNKWIAAEAHKRGLSVGLKNDVDQISQLVHYFDWALNEECVEYNECNKYKPFIDAGKAVFHVEYVDKTSQGHSKQQSVCHSSHRPKQFRTLIKQWDLDAWRLTC